MIRRRCRCRGLSSRCGRKRSVGRDVAVFPRALDERALPVLLDESRELVRKPVCVAVGAFAIYNVACAERRGAVAVNNNFLVVAWHFRFVVVIVTAVFACEGCYNR